MKSKVLLLLALSLSIVSSLIAENWKYTSNFNLSLTQYAYSNNWEGPGRGSISWALTSVSTADKQLTSMFLSKNTLNLAFGHTYQQELNANGQRHWKKPEKTTDKIDFESILRFTLHAYVDPFLGLRFQSQFIDDTDSTKTAIINPILLTESFGVAKSLINKENTSLDANLGIAVRQTIGHARLDEFESITVTENGAGCQLVLMYNQTLEPQNITLNSRLQLFQPFIHPDANDFPLNYFRAFEVTWDSTVSLKLLKSLNIGVTSQLLYNNDQKRLLQFQENLQLGFLFQLL
jgi:hypothetical protein